MIRGFFEPKSVLFLGNTRIEMPHAMVSSAVFERVKSNLGKFDGEVHVVDLGKENRVSYPRADLCILLLTPEETTRILDRIESKHVLILPSGFTKKDKESILRVAKKKGKRIIGPNSICGLLNPSIGLNTTYERDLPVRPGKISIVSQSGGVGASILDYLISNKIGISKLVWLGNAWDVNECDVLEYFVEDRKTKVILMYIETLREPRRFMRIVKKSKKPVIVLKGGVSKESKERAKTHTESLSTSDEIFASALKQCGAIKAESIEELFGLGMLLEQYEGEKIKQIAIISNTGGAAILVADQCHRHGICMAEFSGKTKNDITKSYPEIEPFNPIDIIADADGEKFKNVIEIVLKDKSVDAVVFVTQLRSCLLEPESLEVLKRIKTQKPLVNLTPGEDDYRKVRFFLGDCFPMFRDADILARCLKKLVVWDIF